jgi:HK97 family phage portal protein
VKAFLLGEDLNISNKAGIVVNEETAMRTSAVYACVRVIAETVASLPLPLYKRLPRGKEKATYHPLYTVLHDMPNSDMTSFSFRETMMTHLLLWGNAYAQITRRGNQIVELWPLHPAYIRIEREPVTNKLIYKYTSGTQEILYTGEQILHIQGLSIDGIKGLSPISMARETIGLAQATEEFGSRFFLMEQDQEEYFNIQA